MKTSGTGQGSLVASGNRAMARWRAAWAAPSVRLNRRLGWFDSFSLVEVVAAIGILAVTLIVVLGLIMATVRTVGEVADADAVTRLNENIQGELERLQTNLGLAALASLVPLSGSSRPLRMVATRDGQRVRCADRADPAADRALDDQTLRGIANRDRYFLIEVSQLPGLDFAPASGFLALSVQVSWPYQLPVGPPTPGATGWDVDPAREVPGNERSVVIFSGALRP
jgi:hypothetical protein